MAGAVVGEGLRELLAGDSTADPCFDGIADEHGIVLAALYLRGAPTTFRPPMRRAGEVLSALRRHCAGLQRATDVLRSQGLHEEACALASPGLLVWAQRQVRQGRVLTTSCKEYPRPWESKLGEAAPAALWRDGPIPAPPFVAVVGSREAPLPALRFARACGKRAVELGSSFVSGGAKGCDSWAAAGALQAWDLGPPKVRSLVPRPPLLEIHPTGLSVRPVRRPGSALTVAAATEPFHTIRALERNRLVAAICQVLVICDAQVGHGGAWYTAIEALQNRWCPVMVRADAKSPGCKALAALGARPVESPEDFALVCSELAQRAVQAGLTRT